MGLNVNKRVTLSEKAYEYIKSKIVSGEFKEGELLTEKSIGEALEMSRTPVKKAFTKLEMQNYVRSIDGIGTIVTGISIKDLSDIYEARTVIEVGALSSSIKRINREELKELIEKLRGVLNELNSGKTFSTEYAMELDAEVHKLIIDNSSNHYYQVLMKNIISQIERYRYEAYALTDTTKDVTEDHIEILEAILDNNYEDAKKALESHIAHSFREISTALFDLNIV